MNPFAAVKVPESMRPLPGRVVRQEMDALDPVEAPITAIPAAVNRAKERTH